MKIVSLIMSIVMGMVIFADTSAFADSDGWYVAGGVLAGLAAAAIMSDISRPRYYAEPVYVQPVYPVQPVVYTTPVYGYTVYPYTTTTVYQREVVHVW